MRKKTKRKTNQTVNGKLLKYIVIADGIPLMELLPTEANNKKQKNLSGMVGIEIVKVYEQ